MQTRRRTFDANNNAIECESILLDGLIAVVGDIVWLKHNQSHFLTTPFMVAAFHDSRIEVRDLLCNHVISFTSKRMTIYNPFDVKCIFNNLKCSTRSLFQQHQCRQAIVSLIKSIKSSESRVNFCKKQLPKLLNQSHRYDSKKQQKIIDNMNQNDVDDDFAKYLSNLCRCAKSMKVEMSIEETQLIAETILQDKRDSPLAIPDVDNVCGGCFQPDKLVECRGSCARLFHRKCIRTHSHRTIENIDWRKFEENDELMAQKYRKNLRNFDDIQHKCMDCRSSNFSRYLCTDHSMCLTCKQPINANENGITCLYCSESFHSTTACIPAGAYLLSKTQLLCQNHNNNDVKKIPICSICCRERKGRSSLQRCINCPNGFHKKCHPHQTECQLCLTKRFGDEIVLTHGSKNWWPAIVISNDQVPRRVYHKRKSFGPGAIFVFIIATNDYQQVQASSLLSFRIDNHLCDVICNRNVDNDLDDALEIANTLYQKYV